MNAKTFQERLDECRYLWDGSSPRWVLIKAIDDQGEYSIFDRDNFVLMHIDDPAMHAVICERMIAHGCEILPDMPAYRPAGADPDVPLF